MSTRKEKKWVELTASWSIPYAVTGGSWRLPEGGCHCNIPDDGDNISSNLEAWFFEWNLGSLTLRHRRLSMGLVELGPISRRYTLKHAIFLKCCCRGYPSLEQMADAAAALKGEQGAWDSSREGTAPPSPQQQHFGWWGRHFGLGKDNDKFATSSGNRPTVDVDLESSAARPPLSARVKPAIDGAYRVWATATGVDESDGGDDRKRLDRGSRSSARVSRVFPRG